MKKVLIIGAGVTGLAAGIRLAKKGYNVEIFEKNDKPGGRMNQIEFEGFKFDLGPTILMMPEIYKEVFINAGVNPDDYLSMTQLDPLYKIYFNDGTIHSASSDLTKMISTIEEVSLQEASGFLRYLSDIYSRYLIAKNHFIEKAFRKPSDFYNPNTLYQGLKLKTFDSAYKSIGKFVKDPKLQEILSFQTLYIGLSPFNGPSIYTIIPMIELIYGIWFLKGGMYTYTKAMEKLFLELGGKINYSSPVEKIIIENKKATGIQISHTINHGDYIVNTSDFPYALDQLTPEYKIGKYRKNNLNKLEYSCSCLMLYLGLDKRDFPGLNVHNLSFSEDFTGNINDIFSGKYPDDASLYVYAPGLLDESLAPLGQLGLYVLVPVPNLLDGKVDWNDSSSLDSIKKDVYEKIKNIKPLKDFKKHVIAEKIYTPLDFKNDFNLMHGATFGLKPTLLQSNYYRPQPKARNIDNLYFAGSSNHPGAGVPIVLTSAKLVVEEILKDDK